MGLLGNNSKSEILLSDIKDYGIIPLGSLDYSRNAFINITSLIRSSSNNPLRNSTNNKIPFFPFIFLKDFFGIWLILCLYFLQTHFGISSLSHPDNALEACAL